MWESLLAAVVGSLVSAGAQSAMTPDTNNRSTGFGNIPTMENTQGDEMQAWLAELAKQRGARTSGPTQQYPKGGMM